MQITTLATLADSARAAVGIATKGLPAIRAALWGARIGAGKALDAATVERLGVEVVSEVPALAKTGVRTAMMLGKDGVAVKLGPGGGVSAVVTESSVRQVARATTRTAFAGVARAARQGAVAGALVDGAFGAVEAIRAVRGGQLSTREGLILAGKRTARGAVVGGASVAAAGAASAVIAATGIAVAGAPIIVPLVTMAAAGVVVTRGFDRLFGEGPSLRGNDQNLMGAGQPPA
jgi:hypothetical protein